MVDANGENRRPVTAPAVSSSSSGLALHAPGVAFFKTQDDGLLMVDAIAGTALVLAEDAPNYEDPLQLGGGKRFALFTSLYDTKGLIVDMVARKSRALTDLTTADDADPEADLAASQARISPDERFLAIEDGNDVRFYALDGGIEQPPPAITVPGRFTGFTVDGKAAYVGEGTGGSDGRLRSRLQRVPLDGTAGAAATEIDGGVATVVGDSVLLLLSEKPPRYALRSADGQVRTLDLGLAAEDEGINVIPARAAARAVFVVNDSDRKPKRWGVIEEDGAKVRFLDGLEGTGPASSRSTQFVLLSDIDAIATGEGASKGRLAAIDIERGTSRRVDFDAGGHKLTPGVARLSPDGSRVTLNSLDADPISWVVPLDGSKVTEIKGLFGQWSPDGTQLWGRRIEGDASHLAILPLGGGTERALPGAENGVWTPGAGH
jgi:hypothetical protein